MAPNKNPLAKSSYWKMYQEKDRICFYFMLSYCVKETTGSSSERIECAATIKEMLRNLCCSFVALLKVKIEAGRTPFALRGALSFANSERILFCKL